MSGDYFNGDVGSLGNDPTSSPSSPLQGAVSGRSNALSNRITSVLSRSYADHEIKEALSILDGRGLVNNAKTRRVLRLDAQKEVIECNGAIVMDFGLIAEVQYWFLSPSGGDGTPERMLTDFYSN